jgi:hypothetical protein
MRERAESGDTLRSTLVAAGASGGQRSASNPKYRVSKVAGTSWSGRHIHEAEPQLFQFHGPALFGEQYRFDSPMS